MWPTSSTVDEFRWQKNMIDRLAVAKFLKSRVWNNDLQLSTLISGVPNFLITQCRQDQRKTLCHKPARSVQQLHRTPTCDKHRPTVDSYFVNGEFFHYHNIRFQDLLIFRHLTIVIVYTTCIPGIYAVSRRLPVSGKTPSVQNALKPKRPLRRQRPNWSQK